MSSKKVVFFFVTLLVLDTCIPIWEKINTVSLDDILTRKKLRVITASNQNSYYIYKEQEMGFEYELLSLFASELGIELEITVTKDTDNLPFMLNSTDNDVVMGNLTVNRKYSRELSYTEHLHTTRMVLVQKSKNQTSGIYIQSVLDLLNKKITVRKKSSFYSKIQGLQDELGGKIEIEPASPELSTEELIERVSIGEVEYTIADELTAQISKTYYPNLDISIPVSFPQKISWVVRRNSPELLRELNKWILKVKSDGRLDALKAKYYMSSRMTNPINTITVLKQSTGNKKETFISPYDRIFQEEAMKLDWDWRLLAAICYTESKFNPEARSWAGAVGLMQLMPGTAISLGLSREDFFQPEKNVKTGVKHLLWLDKYWEKIKDKTERQKFVLASYNAGQGHVLDAIQITRERGGNPFLWDKNVAESILLLSLPDIYNSGSIRYGYCRGREPFNYVFNIFKKFKEYKGNL